MLVGSRYLYTNGTRILVSRQSYAGYAGLPYRRRTQEMATTSYSLRSWFHSGSSLSELFGNTRVEERVLKSVRRLSEAVACGL
jgi:hypothetical protein